MTKIGFNIYVDTDTVSPNVIAELWMNMINPTGRWGYSVSNPVIAHVRLNMSADEPFDMDVAEFVTGWDEDPVEFMDRIQKVRFPTLNLTAYMYWDGDGTMIFQHDSGYTVYSTDYKHDNEWEKFPK